MATLALHPTSVDAPPTTGVRRDEDAVATLVDGPDGWPIAHSPGMTTDLQFPNDEWAIPEDPNDPTEPQFLSEQDMLDNELNELLGRNRFSRVEDREWELWDGVDQDAAEREMLRAAAPPWVMLPPGGNLATELESTQPQAMSPMALLELAKASDRLIAWAESIKAEAMASFVRRRRAEYRESPRPIQIDAKGQPIDPERSWYAEIGLALGLSPNTIERRVETALRLTSTLSATRTALRCGALNWAKALAISEATSALPNDAAQAVEAHVLKRAPRQTHRNLLYSLRRQVAKHTTAQAAEAHQAAVAERTCKIVPLADGMSGLWIVNTSDKIQQIWVTIQALSTLAKRHPNLTTDSTTNNTPDEGTSQAAPTRVPGRTTDNTTDGATSQAAPTVVPARTGNTTRTTAEITADTTTGNPTGTSSGSGTGSPTGNLTGTSNGNGAGVGDAGIGLRGSAGSDAGAKDGRTAEQRRADVVADLFEHILHNGLDWLGRRLPDQHRRRPHIEVLIPATTLLGLDDQPAELTGYGPIPADMARRIAADGTWRRLLTDPATGVVLEASTTRHDPSTLVSETLLARHPVCAWPGCNRTSRECDRDHITAFAKTGTTSLSGLAPYCEYHHVIKDNHTWGWTTTGHPDGSITLTTPTGHRYTTIPPARGPIPNRTASPNRPDPDRPDTKSASTNRREPVTAHQQPSSYAQQEPSANDPPPF